MKAKQTEPIQPICGVCNGRKLLLLEAMDTNIKCYCAHCGQISYFYLPLQLEEEKNEN